MKTILGSILFLIMLLFLHLPVVAQSDGSHKTLNVPVFLPGGNSVYETNITFGFNSRNNSGSTEIYRSLSEDEGYSLIATQPAGEHYYTDKKLKPRTKYYFKLRAVSDNSTSIFSEIESFTTLSDFYNPLLAANVINNTEIELTLTDRSYYDSAYTIERDPAGMANAVIEAADSGRTFIIKDQNVKPSSTYTYTVDAYVYGKMKTKLEDVASVTVTTGNDLDPIDLTEPMDAYETRIVFGFSNPNETSQTEIYRATAPDGNFQWVNSISSDRIQYEDTRLKPRATYYYKLRAAKNGNYSEFTEIFGLTTIAVFYNPALTATAVENTVALSLKDRSYNDNEYMIARIPYGEPEEQLNFIGSIIAPDSGRTFTFIDRSAVPGMTYIYSIDALRTHPENTYLSDVARDTVVTNPESNGDLFISGFTLVDPYTEQDIRELKDGDIVDPAGRPTFRANVDSATSSVIFYLNGRIRIENQPPYAYFCDRFGNYSPGRLTKGHYVLEATPYSGNNGEGRKGNTLVIEFDVRDYDGKNDVAANGRMMNSGVSLYPNPVVNSSVLEICARPGSNVRVDVIDQQGNYQSIVSDAQLNNEGYFKKDLNSATLQKGAYIMSIKIDDQVTTRRFIIE